MEEKAREIHVVPFMNRQRKQEPIVKPMLVKVFFLVFMVTLSMLLISTGNVLGYVIYGKEVFEFIMFVAYLVKKRRKNK